MWDVNFEYCLQNVLAIESCSLTMWDVNLNRWCRLFPQVRCSLTMWDVNSEGKPAIKTFLGVVL